MATRDQNKDRRKKTWLIGRNGEERQNFKHRKNCIQCNFVYCKYYCSIIFYLFILTTAVSRDNVVASHSVGPGSNPGWINFLIEVSSWFSLNCKTNDKKFSPHLSRIPLDHHNHPNHSHPSTDGDGLWARMLYMAVIKCIKITNCYIVYTDKQEVTPVFIVSYHWMNYYHNNGCILCNLRKCNLNAKWYQWIKQSYNSCLYKFAIRWTVNTNKLGC